MKRRGDGNTVYDLSCPMPISCKLLIIIHLPTGQQGFFWRLLFVGDRTTHLLSKLLSSHCSQSSGHQFRSAIEQLIRPLFPSMALNVDCLRMTTGPKAVHSVISTLRTCSCRIPLATKRTRHLSGSLAESLGLSSTFIHDVRVSKYQDATCPRSIIDSVAYHIQCHI